MKKPITLPNYHNMVDLQLAFIRIYIGVDFIHHFAEKFGLLGPDALIGVTNYFNGVGFSSMVLIGGLCELGAFIGFTFGIFTRFAAVGTALYLIISLFAGHHEAAGFTWANHQAGVMINGSLQMVYGGWEFPLFWAAMCLSFVLTGGRRWSIDAWIRKRLTPNSPKILKILTA